MHGTIIPLVLTSVSAMVIVLMAFTIWRMVLDVILINRRPICTLRLPKATLMVMKVRLYIGLRVWMIIW